MTYRLLFIALLIFVIPSCTHEFSLNEVDAETLDSLKVNHQLVVTLEDGSKDGGFGERIASYYGTSEMKVMVGGIRKGLYDRYDVQQLLSDNRLLDEQIVEDILSVIND